VDNVNKNQQIECGTLVIAVGMPPDCQLFTGADKRLIQ
jgi:hypothetical protein